jgi:hypothetical protein
MVYIENIETLKKVYLVLALSRRALMMVTDGVKKYRDSGSNLLFHLDWSISADSIGPSRFPSLSS